MKVWFAAELSSKTQDITLDVAPKGCVSYPYYGAYLVKGKNHSTASVVLAAAFGEIGGVEESLYRVDS